MTDTPNFTTDGKMELTDSELKIMQQLLDAHDRGGFYMVYEAMTDSAEAGLQSRISTFSGGVGGVALAANRLDQVEYSGMYPGIYYLSQKVAQSALSSIVAAQTNSAGVLDDSKFYASAEKAWNDAGLLNLFPGNFLSSTGGSLTSLANTFVDYLKVKYRGITVTVHFILISSLPKISGQPHPHRIVMISPAACGRGLIRACQRVDALAAFMQIIWP